MSRIRIYNYKLKTENVKLLFKGGELNYEKYKQAY